MSLLARKILVCATSDGLVIQPLVSKKDPRSAHSVRIGYGDKTLSFAPRDGGLEPAKKEPSFEAFGLVGVITVSKFSFLVSITRRHQVATIRGSPIYVVTEVAITPCNAYKEASDSVETTARQLQRRSSEASGNDDDDSDSDSDSEDDAGNAVEPLYWGDDIAGNAIQKDGTLPVTGLRSLSASSRNGSISSIAEDVMSRRGSYGRFAQRWFSHRGWVQDQKRMMGLTDDAKPEEDMTEANPGADGNAEPAIGVREPAADSATESEDATAPGTPTSPVSPAGENKEATAVVNLLPKLLRSAQMLFGSSRAFYFSYDHDITRSLAKQPRTRWNTLPLHKLVDPLYFWNRHAILPFINLGADSLVLPLMQGFVGQRTFVVDGSPPQADDEGSKDAVELSNFAYKPSSVGDISAASPPQPTSLRTSAESLRRPSEKQFDLTLISRRSVKRAGLRYLRRGVDEDGNVANNVETEQILSPSANQVQEPPLPPLRIYSFVQVRGSIPLFWTQSPFSLKPVPVLQHSLETNFVALRKHLETMHQRYGKVEIVNLVEKHNVEVALGTQFERSVQRANDECTTPEQKSPFEWFDFHSACRGMKFENVSLLLNKVNTKLEEFGSTVKEEEDLDCESVSPIDNGNTGAIIREQTGVLRTNCMDCLDRTNVCQSSFAKFMLDAQLKEQGFDMTLQRDQENAWFNTLWADNGDAVSKQYASTAAMKGDFTRTRKRDYRGALTDAGLSLTRYFNGVVNDFFLQTTIDFLLGNVTDEIFDEFEANMMTKDPAMSMQKMREQAIDLCQRRVVADDAEEFVGGWTLLAPHDADTSLSAPPFEEVVLLLTDTALYLCRFDWNLDKLSSFERVELAHIVKITVGTYILSTVTSLQMEESRNVGFMVSYQPGQDDIMRINTRSLSSIHLEQDSPEGGQDASDVGSGGGGGGGGGIFASFLGRRPGPPPPKRIAFKALYTDTSLATAAAAAANENGPKLTEKEQVLSIASEIERLVQSLRPRPAGTEPKSLLVRGDIVSLAEARKSTGLFEHLGHSLKKLVWA